MGTRASSSSGACLGGRSSRGRDQPRRLPNSATVNVSSNTKKELLAPCPPPEEEQQQQGLEEEEEGEEENMMRGG